MHTLRMLAAMLAFTVLCMSIQPHLILNAFEDTVLAMELDGTDGNEKDSEEKSEKDEREEERKGEEEERKGWHEPWSHHLALDAGSADASYALLLDHHDEDPALNILIPPPKHA